MHNVRVPAMPQMGCLAGTCLCMSKISQRYGFPCDWQAQSTKKIAKKRCGLGGKDATLRHTMGWLPSGTPVVLGNCPSSHAMRPSSQAMRPSSQSMRPSSQAMRRRGCCERKTRTLRKKNNTFTKKNQWDAWFQWNVVICGLLQSFLEVEVAEVHVALPVVVGDIVDAGTDVIAGIVHDGVV